MERRIDIDLLKGLAIIAVVLYHIGILPFGYLGVDMFLVISGYLVIPPVINKLSTNEFKYFNWIWRRLSRFLPLVIIVCAVSMIIGYLIMMPDDYENLAASSFASEIFCNNILQSITTRNYWNTANEYKPLLALWYLGVVFQFFIIFPLILLIVKRFVRNNINLGKILINTIIISGIISFSIFLLLPVDYNIKFYYVPFRFWEFCIGCIIYYWGKSGRKFNQWIFIFSLITIILIICQEPKNLQELNNFSIVGVSDPENHLKSKELLLLSIVLLTSVLLLSNIRLNKFIKPLITIGEMSMSIFVWHQLILAFIRYFFNDTFNFIEILSYIVITFIISTISYYLLETIKLKSKGSITITSLAWCIVLIFSFYVYHRAGVMRDVPEMGVSYDNPYEVRNTEYIDRCYSWNKPFSTNKTKVLVIGNSFARDFACTLSEWRGSNNLEISYMPIPLENDNRYSESDYIFFFGKKTFVPSYVWDNINDKTKIYGIGTKSFGKSFGKIYSKRQEKDYYLSDIPVPTKLLKANEEWKNEWGDNFIDFLNASTNEKGNIRLFTPDSLIISFDCAHLSPAGAKYFSNKLNFERIFKKENL